MTIRANLNQGFENAMLRISTVLILFLLTSLAGGALFLATWDIPAPSAPVERVLPDDNFPG